MKEKLLKLDFLFLPLLGGILIAGLWYFSSATWAGDLPNPTKTWTESKPYVLDPFGKRGEMDQGILRFTWLSLILVANRRRHGVCGWAGAPAGSAAKPSC